MATTMIMTQQEVDARPISSPARPWLLDCPHPQSSWSQDETASKLELTALEKLCPPTSLEEFQAAPQMAQQYLNLIFLEILTFFKPSN